MEEWEKKELRRLVKRVEDLEAEVERLIVVKRWANEVHSLLLFRADGDFALMRMMRNAPAEVRESVDSV